MQFRIIEDLHHPDRKRVGLWLRFKTPNTSELMLAGGTTVEVEQTLACALDPNSINMMKRDLENMQAELRFLKLVDNGTFGYLHQQDQYYGVIQRRKTCPVLNIDPLRITRSERISELQKYVDEMQVDVYRCAEMQWLMDAGKLFDNQAAQEKKELWLQAVRTQTRQAAGTQISIF